jgi:hypothetical protein
MEWNISIKVPFEQKQSVPNDQKDIQSKSWVTKYETPKKKKTFWFEDKENNKTNVSNEGHISLSDKIN